MALVSFPPITRLRSGTVAGAFAALYLLAALALFVHGSLHWPLVGDAPLLHYCVFLLRHGWAPYRQFFDINLPGTYAVQSAVIGLFGYGALPWRLFDLLLLLLLGAASLPLVWAPRQRGWSALAALWVTTVFALEHGRDGLIDLGQRDLLMTVLVAGAMAAVSTAPRFHRASLRSLVLFCGGAALGAAVTIKPIALLLLPCLPAIPVFDRRWNASDTPARWTAFATTAAGALLAPLAAVIYLLRRHSLGSFLSVETTLVPLHASLFRRPLPFLLTHWSVRPCSRSSFSCCRLRF